MVFEAKNRQEAISIIQNLTDQEELNRCIHYYYDDPDFLDLIKQHSTLEVEGIIYSVQSDILFDETEYLKEYLTDGENVKDTSKVEGLKSELRTVVTKFPQPSKYGLETFIDELAHERTIAFRLLKFTENLQAGQKSKAREDLKTKLWETYSMFLSDYKEYLPDLAENFIKQLGINEYDYIDFDYLGEVIGIDSPDVFYPLLFEIYLILKHESYNQLYDLDDIPNFCEDILYIILDHYPDIPGKLLDELKLISSTIEFFEELLEL